MKLGRALRAVGNLFRGGLIAEQQRFLFAELLSNTLYPKYKFAEFGRLYLEDREFLSIYESFEGTRNYHSLDRKYALAQLQLLTRAVPGDTVECGVFQGASSYVICRGSRGTDKHHLIFDSFEGLSRPESDDGAYWQPGDLACAEDKVRARLADFHFVEYFKGWIPSRFQEVADRKFSFVHLDVDLYQPTKDSLHFFYPRLSPGGLLICDDYGFVTCPGSKKALDEFFADKQEKVVMLPTGQGFIQKQHFPG